MHAAAIYASQDGLPDHTLSARSDFYRACRSVGQSLKLEVCLHLQEAGAGVTDDDLSTTTTMLMATTTMIIIMTTTTTTTKRTPMLLIMRIVKMVVAMMMRMIIM